jgi:hypothetical protein
MKDEPRSEWIKAGMPNKQKSCVRQSMTVEEDTSGQGKANGNLENSSIIVSR